MHRPRPAVTPDPAPQLILLGERNRLIELGVGA
jgi:hypothetical protein